MAMPRRTPITFTISSSLFAAALAVMQVLPASATVGSAPLDEGVRQFLAGRYILALGPLERAVSKAPQNAMCRYYLANCYVHLSRHEDAMKEYDMAYRLDPFGPLSGYCRRALIGYGKAVPGESEMAAIGRPIAAAPAARPAAGTIQYNNSDSINKAVDTIRRQADVEKDRHRLSFDAFSSNAVRTGEGTARKILDDADNEIKAIMDAPLVVAGGSGNAGLAQQAKELELQRRQNLANEIRKRAETDAARIRAEAQDRSQKFKQYSQDRQAALDEVANSLESQLSSSRLQDRVKLRAEGTGLYVRNFGVLPSPSPEIHQGIARIHPRENPARPDEVVAGPNGDSAGDPGKLPASDAPAPAPPESTVSGKVLDKKPDGWQK